MKITMKNDYHNTQAEARPRAIAGGRYTGYHRISKQVARRLYNQLCGSSDCTCGDTFGARGQQEYTVDIINEDYYEGYIVAVRRVSQ